MQLHLSSLEHSGGDLGNVDVVEVVVEDLESWEGNVYGLVLQHK